MDSQNIAEKHGIQIPSDEQPKGDYPKNESTTFLLHNPKLENLARQYMRLALSEAQMSPPKPTNYCVGALLLRAATTTTTTTTTSTTPSLEVLATGYTLECEGNTHAEQCCFIKLAAKLHCSVEELGDHIDGDVVLYTTMEPCNQRSVGNAPCVDRILALKTAEGKQVVKAVVCGVAEPSDLVATNSGRARLEAAGIQVGVLRGMEEEILRVAKAGHVPSQDRHEDVSGPSRSNIRDVLN